MFLPRIEESRFRPQDAALLAGLVLSLPRSAEVQRARRQPVAIAAFLLVGLVAMVLGIVGENAIRECSGTPAGGPCTAAAAGPDERRDRLGRRSCLLLGTTIFAVVVMSVAALPAFEGALKLRALEFDRGLLRMQFGNSTLLLATLAAATVATIRRPDPIAMGIGRPDRDGHRTVA